MLELKPDDQLFCERGEDIEIISGVLGAGTTPEQLLEQVKIRRAISLRSPEVVSAMIRLFEVRQRGGHPTLFRFITTGKAAKEQGATFPRNLSGLVAWNEARNRDLDNDEIVRVAEEAMRLLRRAAKPADIPQKLAGDFAKSLDGLTPADFTKGFIDRIEWAVNAEGVDSLRDDLSRSLVVSGLVTEAQALISVDLLMAHVFRLLTKPGPKCLRKGDIGQVLRQTELSNHDQRVLALLESLAVQTRAQLAALETKTDQIIGLVSKDLQDTLTTVFTRVEGLTAQQIVSPPSILDAPPTIEEWIATRPGLVTQIGQGLARGHVQTLLGPAGMGKTTLAALVFHSWPHTHRHWISLKQRIRAEAMIGVG